MKKEPIYDYLRRRLSELKGHHVRIARETGVPQTTVSRINQGLCSPTLASVQPLLDWFDRHDKGPAKRPSTSRFSNAKRIHVNGSAARRATPATLTK